MKFTEIVTLIVFLALAVMLMQTRCQLKSLQDSMPTGAQPSEYHLPDDVVFAADLKQHELRILERIGVDSVFISETYIPSESSIEYIVRIDTIAMGQLEEAQLLLAQLEADMETASDSQAVVALRESIEELKLSLAHAELIFDKKELITDKKSFESALRETYKESYGLYLELTDEQKQLIYEDFTQTKRLYNSSVKIISAYLSSH